MTLEEPVFLSQGPFGRLRELQSILAKSDIAAEIVQPPGSNTNAWGTRFLLAVAGDRAAEAARRIDEDFLAGLDDEARRAATAVIDLDADENACPACGDPFTGAPSSCPSCGLRIGP